MSNFKINQDKNFLICVARIVVLCSCSSKKKQAEYWKGWVAIESYESQPQSEWNNV